ncbi:MAG: hypothetical protein JWQ89_2221 [Devosia sp.]|uniref:DUF29 domain-containing protein n=1 Tax=Devosia sp. TaxID=1871048 RepID=UPI00262609D9|nr:DUF29 domain-containing protein [Devosia sp.]MDB5540494.1 hypothetical protein [Devosia sp.]
MNKIDLKKLAGYEEDFALWSAEQAALIRAGKFDRVDLENVAEEIESLGRSDKHQIRSRLEVLMMHLLKWEKQPEHRSRSWASTIRGQRDAILDLLKESPSLKPFPATVIAERYARAREMASEETTVYLKYFPETCPYTIEQILDPDFLPGEL